MENKAKDQGWRNLLHFNAGLTRGFDANPGAADALGAAVGAARGGGEAVAFVEGEVAFFAGGGGDLEGGADGAADVGEVVGGVEGADAEGAGEVVEGHGLKGEEGLDFFAASFHRAWLFWRRAGASDVRVSMRSWGRVVQNG